MVSRAAARDRSLAWWEQRRARGVCAVCQLPLGADKAWPVHAECARLLDRRYTYADIRAMSPAERRAKSAKIRRKDLEQL